MAIDRENAIELHTESQDIECQIATLKTAGGKLVPSSGGDSELVDFYAETKFYADKNFNREIQIISSIEKFKFSLRAKIKYFFFFDLYHDVTQTRCQKRKLNYLRNESLNRD